MKANLTSISVDTSSVIDRTHSPIVQAMEADADIGILEEGMIAAKNVDDEIIAHVKTSEVAMTGTINGTNDDFTATLSPRPVLPGSVRIDNNNAAGAQVVVDDGLGNLTGDCSAGTVNYETGAVAVTLTTPPETGKTVLISHKTKPVGVITSDIDTDDDDDAAPVLRHGTVVKDKLISMSKVGSAAATEGVPDAEDLEALAAIGIYAL